VCDQLEYPTELDAVFTLPDNRRLRVRALHPDEDGPIRELDAHLSPRSRYFRYLSPMPVTPETVVRLLASVDYRRRLTLVAEIDSGSRGEVIGLASFCAVDDRNVEVALAVRDDWQRQRVGTELVHRVIDAAEARGFDRFIAHVTAENIAMRRLLKSIGDVVSAKADGAVSELVFVRRERPHVPRRKSAIRA
jgi:RimJ/RimL family protein N-acetyltransferase